MKSHHIYIDVLKIIASLSVVFIHAAASKWYIIPVDSSDFNFLNLINSLTRQSVPIFVMLTGLLLLSSSHSKSFSEMFKKYAFKAALSFVVASFLYAVLSFILDPQPYTNIELLMQLIYRTLKGPSHLWYLWMIVGLYMIHPFIEKMLKNDFKLIEKFIILSFILNSVLHLNLIFKIDTLFLYTGFLNITLGTGFVLYYVLGYYLYQQPLKPQYRKFLYSLAILSLVFTYLLTQHYSLLNNSAFEDFYGYLQPNIFFMASASFVFFQNLEPKLQKLSTSIKQHLNNLASNNLLIYIIHPMVITFIHPTIEKMSSNLPIYIILLTLVSYGLSSLIAILFKRIQSLSINRLQ